MGGIVRSRGRDGVCRSRDIRRSPVDRPAVRLAQEGAGVDVAMPTKELTGLEIAHLIEQGFPGAVEEAQPEFAMIAADRLVEVMTWLRDDGEQQFKFLSSLTGVDREEWFEIVYHLESIKFNRLVSL